MEDPTTIAVDLAKSVFEISVSREPGRVCQRKRLTRSQFARYLALQPPATLLVVPVGSRLVLPRLAQAIADPTAEIPEILHPVLHSAAAEIRQLEANIREVERQLDELSKSLPAAANLRSVPGIGLLTATALIASLGDPSRFKNGRRLASCLGLVPKEHSSGSSRHLGAITKRGDPYLRTLLIHGARSVLLSASRAKHPDRLQAWALALQRRRGHNRATVALANKLTRIAWAVSAHQCRYQSATA
jgi:transposase